MAQAFNVFAKPHLINRTARYKCISSLCAVLASKQYDGKASWWTGKDQTGKHVPIQERKPCVRYRLAKTAIEQLVRFLFGEGRFPNVSVETAEDEADGYPAVSDDDATTLTSWVSKLIERCNVQPQMEEVAEKAIGLKTAVVVLEADQGVFRMTLPQPHDCAAVFEDDDPTHPVKRLLWCYEFQKEVADPIGNPILKTHYFRREWDATSVYVWDDVEKQVGIEPAWGAPTITPHGLGFCPVLWIRNADGCCDNNLDGTSLIEDFQDDITALDLTLSRRHQGVLVLGSPQLVETAEELEQGPDQTGRPTSDEATYASSHGKIGGERARRMGPEYVWQYLGKRVDVKLLEASGTAFKLATDHVNDIRSRLLEQWGVVLTSMADTVSRTSQGGEMSARFLMLAHAPMIATVQELRKIWWPFGLRPVVTMLMRMTLALEDGGQNVFVSGTDKVVPILKKFVVGGKFVTPNMTPKWGAFFDPSADEVAAGVGATIAAKDGGLIARKTAIEHVAHDFDIDNVEVEIDEIDTERQEQDQRDLENQQNQLKAMHELAGGNSNDGGTEPGGAPPPGGAKPPPAPPGGGRGNPPPPKPPKKSAAKKRRPPSFG